MSEKLDMDKIAERLGAERRGDVEATGGYFGALQLAAEIQTRLRVPSGGGRPTDPRWTERRVVPVTPRTLSRLREIADSLQELGNARAEPMQVAAVLLEKAVAELSQAEVQQLVRSEATPES